MPIKGEQQGYTYKALINGEWQEITIQESPLELAELFEQDEEWTRVKHGHWINKGDYAICSECGANSGTQYNGLEPVPRLSRYCPDCGAKMDEEGEDEADRR